MVRQVGKNWVVLSEKGKRLGTYKSKKDAEERLRQIEYLKHIKGGK